MDRASRMRRRRWRTRRPPREFLLSARWTDRSQRGAARCRRPARPPVAAIDRRRGFKNHADVPRQSCVASLFLFAEQFTAILKIAELVFQQNQVEIHLGIFSRVVRPVIGDRFVPDFLFGSTQWNRGWLQ